tara:strand:- start:1120 stop:1389 length:270 start_codon:yes stop_codon:yes gene_type:complete
MKMKKVIRRKGQVEGMCENCRHHAKHNPPEKEYNYVVVYNSYYGFNETIRWIKPISEIEDYEKLPQNLFCKDCSRLVETLEEEYEEPVF